MRRAGVIWGSAIGLLLALLTAGHALVPVSQMLYDVIAVITSPRRADPRVALIVIDQESIDRLGAFPWSREVHARLLDRLAPAKASSIAFNIAFTESSASDEALADAMRRAGNVYLPVLRNVRRVAPLITYDPPPSQLVLAAAGLGHIGASLDSDGVVRRVAIEDAIGQEGYLPIGVIASLPRLGVSLADLVSPTQGHYHIGSLDIPINGSMETSLGYSGGPDVFPQFSYVEVLEGEVSPDEFRDRIVIIGAAAEGLGDRHPTPFSRWGAPPMTGVELHANVAAMLLNRRFHSIFEPEWLPATFIPLLALWGAWAGPQAAAMRLLLSLGALTGSALLWAAGWIFGGVYLDPTPIWLGVGLSYLGLAYWEIHTVNGLTRRQLARLRNEGAQLPELGQHADRIVNAAMWLLRPAGVALYAGAGRRLAAAGGVPAELPPTLSAESIRAQRWNGGDAPLRDWLTQRSVVYSPVYPLTPDGRRPLGWLTLFFPKDSPHVIMQGANYRLEPGAQALLTAFQHQAATLLPPAEPGRGADVVAQMATLLDLDRELLSQYGILTATSQHIADGVAACDLTGAIYFLNRAMAPLADTAEWLGGDMAGLLERVGLFPAGQGADRLRNLFSSPEPGQGEVTVNGRTWRVTLTRIDDVDARPLGIVTVFSDITDLRALDRARDEMMSFLAHELRTPLTSVMGAAALLAEVWTGDDETGPIALELLEGGARRMELLIDDLLQISRLEAGRLTLRPRMMEAEGALREALQLVQGAAAARHISFVQETESLTVEADPLRLVQVLTNLLSNAVKYSPEDATVRVCVQRTGEMAHFSVADQGAGIPQAEQRRLFTKFYRGSNVAQTTEGTGLGLVIVKRLVEMQGGEITVQSREGVGTTFAFTVPLASDDDGDEME